MEFDDAGAWTRLRLALREDFRRSVHGIAFEQRGRELDSVIPRLAIVVPTLRSETDMPIINPSVNSEFMSGWPHSVSVSQNAGRCAAAAD
jgi:hypothetical protein